MSLSSEDSLRLNVLMAGGVDAVRIDESRMVVHGLRAGGEAEVSLNPNCRDEQYIRQVREFLSTHVLGSPGGYPVFLKRWTRMGQARDESLADLLKLGEPEAVMAVVCAPGLDHELARRAWWAAPEAEHARRMLERDTVASSDMGKVLADFLIEFLPFETEPGHIVRSVRLILRPGLVDEVTCRGLWERGRAKNVFRIGFLEARPNDLPEPLAARADAAHHEHTLADLAAQGNALADMLRRTLSGAGQTFLQAAEAILKKPANQEVVESLLNAVGGYFQSAWDGEIPRASRAIEEVEQRAGARLETAHDAVTQVLRTLPELRAEIEALLFLAQIQGEVATPIFARTDAIGTVMRKKLVPVTDPIFQRMRVLRGAG